MGNACSCQAEREEEVEPVEEPEKPVEETPEPSPDAPKLTLTVVGASGLRNAGWLPGSGKSDCYCIVKYQGKEVFRTSTIANSLDPIWMDECDIPDYADDEPLEFGLFDRDWMRSHSLGQVRLESGAFASGGFNGEVKVESSGRRNTEAYLRLKIKVRGSDCPPGPPSELRMSVERGAERSYGLDLDTQAGATLFVLGVKKGPCRAYNEGAKPADRLRRMDFIVAVNGVSGDSARMLGLLASEPRVDLVVRRPQEAAAVVEKRAGEPLGAEFPKRPVGDHLVVQKVVQGPLREWNRRQPQGQRVRAGDRIVAVSGCVGKAPDLEAKVERGARVRLTMLRPGDAGTSWSWSQEVAV